MADDDLAGWPTGRLLSAAARRVERDWRSALEALGLTHAGLVVLHLLDSGDAAQIDLAAAARVSVQTMSRTVDRLVREGFVERRRDVRDRRRVLVSPTVAGRAAFARAASLEADVFPRLDAPEQLRAALLQIVTAERDARPPIGGAHEPWRTAAPRA